MIYFGIYARKSVFSDASDSIQVQIDLCRDYINRMYVGKDIDIVVYGEDEGFTGANTNRPGYQKMITDIENKRLNVVVCYRIDRISRDVKDFSNVFDFMQQHSVSFISITEQIDTTTPLGRAMMYICSVFAQMERETIAERVRDNMISLAKSGKWAGGKAPVGYSRERTIVNGKEHTILVPDKSEMPFLNMLYDTFLSGNTLSSLEIKFRKQNIKSLNGYFLSSTQIYNILSSPHLVENTAAVWDFFSEKGCIMATERDNFDGKHGIIVYGRTSGSRSKKHVVNSADKWIVTTGLHEPIMHAERWLAVQKRFGLNKIDKTSKHEIGILKGIMKCQCGHAMRVQHKVDSITKKVYDNYFCQNRNRRGIEYCDMKMISVDKIDNSILNLLEEIATDKNVIKNYIDTKKDTVTTRSKTDITKAISVLEKKIEKLTSSLSENSSSTAAKYIISEIEKIDSQLLQLQSELREYNISENNKEKESNNIDSVYNNICSLISNFPTLNFYQKNSILKELINECVWDGKELHILF